MLLATAKSLQQVTFWVYVLACKNNTYYVGFSRFLHNRLIQHFAGEGAQFTRANKPYRLLEMRKASSEQDEFTVWRQYAWKYGTSRVGGYNPWLCEKLGFTWPRGFPRRTSRKDDCLDESHPRIPALL